MKGLLSRYYTYGILAIWIIACFVFFQGFYSYHFFYKEQTQLFLLSADYLGTYFSKPAWLACMAGDFFTQFYYYEFAGTVILISTLLVLGDLIRRCMDKLSFGKFSFWIALLIMTLEAVCHLGANFALSSTFSVIGALFLFLIYVRITKKWLSWIFAIFFTVIAYWLFGYGCFVFTILVIAYDIRKGKEWLKIVLMIILLTIPLLLRGHYLLSREECFTYPGIGELRKPNFELETILSLDNEFYFGNTKKVIELAKKSNLEIPEISYFYNLAQAKQGTMVDSLLYFYQPADKGLFLKSGPHAPLIDLYIENELYDMWGDMTLDEHAAILASVFSPDNRNVRMIKRLAEVNLVKNDTTAAMKYLRILDKTIVYHKWSEYRIPGRQSQWIKKEIYAKQKYINRYDTLREPDDNAGILRGLLKSNVRNTVALDYLLCSELLTKNISKFKDDYDTFCMKTGFSCKKRIYQEALMIYLAEKNAKPEEWEKYKLSPEIGEDFKDYTNVYVKSKGNKAALIDRFAHSYWFYFHFINLK